MKNKIICMAIFNLCFFTIHSQSIRSLEKVFPPSPEASVLAEYGKVPVDLYHGLINLNLPLLTLHNKDIDIPLSLSYHSAGNKVNEISSSIGLGWALNTGGLITRVVRGLNDDHDNGYCGLNQRGLNI